MSKTNKFLARPFGDYETLYSKTSPRVQKKLSNLLDVFFLNFLMKKKF